MAHVEICILYLLIDIPRQFAAFLLASLVQKFCKLTWRCQFRGTETVHFLTLWKNATFRSHFTSH